MTPPSEGGSTTGEVAEQTPAQRNNQDGAADAESVGQNLTDGALHLISSRGQSSDQSSDSGRSFQSTPFLSAQTRNPAGKG